MAHTINLKGRIMDLPFDVRKDVCILLNQHLNNDYRKLAHHMGYNVQDIKTFEQQTEDPTDAILYEIRCTGYKNVWATEKSNRRRST